MPTWLLALFARYGYAVVFAGVFLENTGLPVPGETAVILAGLSAASGRLSIVLVIVVASAAAIIGDNIGFLIGGTVLGIGRGEEVYPLQDLPSMHLVIVTPPISVSTPKAFAQWDKLVAREAELTGAGAAGTINKFSQAVDAWLKERVFSQAVSASGPASGVPAMGGDRAETPLLDLVRAGIENDFERVVFPEYPDLREVKRVLQREGARYASLSGSGSTLYGVFGTGEEALAAAARMSAVGHAAVATTTLTREEYWKQLATSN